MKRSICVRLTHLPGQENIVKKIRLLLKSSPIFRSMLNKEDEGCLRYAYPQMSTKVWKVYMVVIATPFVITLWVPTTAHADQD